MSTTAESGRLAANRERAARMAEHFDALAKTVGAMLKEYEDSSMDGELGDNLNDIQPKAAVESYAASLDEWLHAIWAGRDCWREIAETGEEMSPIDQRHIGK